MKDRQVTEEGSMPASQPLSWYALHTRPRQEERAAQNLTAWGVETLVPKLRRAGASSATQILFPSYIFARFDECRMLHKIRFTRGVLYVVSFAGRLACISDHVIAAIGSRMGQDGVIDDTPLVIDDTPLMKPGDPVMVKAGPLRNLMGVFEKKLPGRARVQILLTAVTYSARSDVCASDLTLCALAG